MSVDELKGIPEDALPLFQEAATAIFTIRAKTRGEANKALADLGLDINALKARAVEEIAGGDPTKFEKLSEAAMPQYFKKGQDNPAIVRIADPVASIRDTLESYYEDRADKPSVTDILSRTVAVLSGTKEEKLVARVADIADKLGITLEPRPQFTAYGAASLQVEAKAAGH